MEFPDPLPSGTAMAYARSYGGFTGGHAYLAVAADGRGLLRCRFKRAASPVRITPDLVKRWESRLARARLESIPSDDPADLQVESPETWLFYRGRTLYLQAFAHRRPSARLAAIPTDLGRYVSRACR